MALKIKISFLIGILLLPLSGTVLTVQAEDAGPVKRKLMVTAYYSPLPDQSFYIKGSYEADMRLNGRGTNGADGTPVYVGMLAAPKNYPFGTRVFIPGLGVGEVHDRGGAILANDNYDRIDVWMGHGEEGLSRALNWGARTVEGEIYFSPNQAQPGLDYSWVSSTLPEAYVAKLQANSVVSEASETEALSASLLDAEDETDTEAELTTSSELAQPKQPTQHPELRRLEQESIGLQPGLGAGDEGESVGRLQSVLWELGFYQHQVNGLYDDRTTEAVFRLQLAQGVVTTETDLGAGYFGPKTLVALQNMVGQKVDVMTRYPQEAQAWVPARQTLPKLNELALESTPPRRSLSFTGRSSEAPQQAVTLLADALKVGDRGEEVKQLQEHLIEGGYLASGLNTGYYGEKTAQAVLAFQEA